MLVIDWAKQVLSPGSRDQIAAEDAPPASQNPVPVGVVPEGYNLGQLPSISADIMRAVQVTAQSIIDPLQYINQSYQVHDYAVEGLWRPYGQNISVLTAQGTSLGATLVPAYGQYMDTAQNVYANIASGGF